MTVIQRMSYIYVPHVNLSTPTMEISRHLCANDLIWFRKHAKAAHALIELNANIFYRANISFARAFRPFAIYVRLPLCDVLRKRESSLPRAYMQSCLHIIATWIYFTCARKRHCDYLWGSKIMHTNWHKSDTHASNFNLKYPEGISGTLAFYFLGKCNNFLSHFATDLMKIHLDIND